MSPPSKQTAPKKSQPKANTKPKNKNKTRNAKPKSSDDNNKAQSKKNHPNKPNQNHQKPTIILPHYHTDILKSLDNSISPPPVFVQPQYTHDKASTGARHREIYETNIIGHFTCTNPSCRPNRPPKSKSWSSKVVAIVIRRFDFDQVPGSTKKPAWSRTMGYNATIYNQRCRVCEQLGVMKVDKEVYVERVAYRLKKWAGVPVEAPPYHVKRETPPHEMELCEGCKSGVCLAGRAVV